MKTRNMPADQYRFSMEARPLRVLYSKYNPNEINSSLQIVRPPGRIRKDRKLFASVDANREKKRSSSRAELIENGVRLDRLGNVDLSHIDEDKMKNDQRNGHEHGRSGNQNASRLDFNRDTDNASPVAGRSRSQDFEQKFKLAVARRAGQESPPPITRSHTSFNKKVVHLPLFRVNLKTYAGDSAVTQTVASTRESLRRLMDIHRCKMKPANLITANIRNYEFSAPSTASRSGSSGTVSASSIQPFPSKPMLKSSKTRDRLFVKQTSFVHKRTNGVGKEYTENNFTLTSQDRDDDKRINREKVMDAETECNYGHENSIWSMAIRPDTSLTLGSTMNQIDRVIKSPTSDELRELSEVFKGSESPPGWPNVDELQKLRTRSRSSGFGNRRSRTSLSRSGTILNDHRPGTVLNNVPETPEEVWNAFRNDESYADSGVSPTGSFGVKKPVLRYTSNQSAFKLDPIVVPSHTCTECEMCNLYQRDLETSCPPNSPMSTQCPDPGLFITSTKDATEVPKSSSSRVRPIPAKAEVMHIARINMNDGMYMNEDGLGLGCMKAKG